MNRITLVALLLLMSPLATRAATTVSFDVGASGSFGLSATEEAGVVRAAHWNSLTGSGSSDSFSNAVDDTGAATAISLSISSADGVNWQGNTYHGLTGNDANVHRDSAFANFFNPDGTGDTLEVDFSGIGYSDYDIYLYTGAGGTDRGGSITDGNTTYYVKGFDAGSAVRDYIEGTETESYASAGSADYVVFRGLTGETQSFTFAVEETQIFFSGAQIVGNTNTSGGGSGASSSLRSTASAVPEPSSGLIFALTSLGFLTRRRRRK